MSLNDKLAELCGVPLVNDDEGNLWRLHPELETDSEFDHRSPWNPLQDLNQLKMCYEAARFDVGSTVICEHLEELVGGLCDMGDALNVLCDKPELVAQAILRAKGVEL